VTTAKMNNLKPITATLMCDGSSLNTGTGFAGTLKLYQDGSLVDSLDYAGGVENGHALMAEAVAVESGFDHLQQWMDDHDVRDVKSVVVRSDSNSVLNAYSMIRKKENPNPVLRELARVVKDDLESSFNTLSSDWLTLEKVKAHVSELEASPLEKLHNEIDKRARVAASDFGTGIIEAYSSRLLSKHFGVTVHVMVPDQCAFIQKKKQFEYGREYAKKNVKLSVKGMGVNSIEHPFLKGYLEEMNKRDESERIPFDYALQKNANSIPNETVAWVKRVFKAGGNDSLVELNTSMYRKAIVSTMESLGGDVVKPGGRRSDKEPSVLLSLMGTSIKQEEATAYANVLKHVGSKYFVRQEISPETILSNYIALEGGGQQNDSVNALRTRLKEMVIYAGLPDPEGRSKAERLIEAVSLEDLPLGERDKTRILTRPKNSMKDKPLFEHLSNLASRLKWGAVLASESKIFPSPEETSLGGYELKSVDELKCAVSKGYEDPEKAQIRMALSQIIESIPEKGVSPRERMDMFADGLERLGVDAGERLTMVALRGGKHSTFITEAMNEWRGGGYPVVGPIGEAAEDALRVVPKEEDEPTRGPSLR
jgi:hypothetical protein